MRFSLQKKVIVLGIGLSLFLMIASFLISFFIFQEKTKENFIKNIDNSISELEYSIGDDSTIDDMSTIVMYTLEPYLEHINDEIPEFKTKEEEFDYYRQIYSSMYPARDGQFDASLQKLKNRNIYLDVASSLQSAAISAGSNAAYAGIIFNSDVTGDSGRFLYLFDSQFRFSEHDWKGNPFGSDYHLTSDDKDINPDAISGEFIIKNKTARVIDFNLGKYSDIIRSKYGESVADEMIESAPKELRDMEIIITAFIEYDIKAIDGDLILFGIIDAISLFVISLLFVIAYILIARFIFVKNVLRLTESTNEFRSNIMNGEVKDIINPDIKSNDEIGVLSDSFVKMEEEIINYTKKIEQATTEREKINAELQVATKIQLESLPTNSLNDENVLIRTSIKSAKEVGGDFYDYFYIDNDHLAIIVSDVSGKGIPAALFMMKSKELLKSKLMKNISLEKACYEVNNELLANNEAGLFITAFVGILNVKTLELEIVSAGHEKPYLIRKNDVNQLDIKSNFILGGIDDFTYQHDIIKLNRDDKLFLYTDGLNESINDSREEFGYERIKDVLAKNKYLRLNEIIDVMTNSLNEFTNNKEAFDDITMVILEIKNKELNFKYENPDYMIIEEVSNKFTDYYSYIDKNVLSKVCIIFDELLNNYISYEKVPNLIIEIYIKYDNNCFTVLLRNNGNEFNPLLQEKKYIEDDKDLVPGGLGITMVREMSDDVIYERKDGFNNLTIKMKV